VLARKLIGCRGAYRCNIRLAEARGSVEAALLTRWWATPILAGMALLRWLRD